MTFNELAKEVGFGLAVVICQDKLPKDFFRNLDFEQWQATYEATYRVAGSGSPLGKLAIEKMGEKVEIEF